MLIATEFRHHSQNFRSPEISGDGGHEKKYSRNRPSIVDTYALFTFFVPQLSAFPKSASVSPYQPPFSHTRDQKANPERPAVKIAPMPTPQRHCFIQREISEPETRAQSAPTNSSDPALRTTDFCSSFPCDCGRPNPSSSFSSWPHIPHPS